MKVYDTITKKILTAKEFTNLKTALEKRLEFLEDNEPDSNGKVYDKWEDSVSELEDILDKVAECIEENNQDYIYELWNDIVGDLIYYQDIYGGLKRLEM